MEGKVGIVTGAGTPMGIGRSLVVKLAKAGAKAVYACDLNLSSIASLQQECEQTGSKTIVEGRLLDVSSEEQTVSILKEIVKNHGRFDFFVANAGFANYRYDLLSFWSSTHLLMEATEISMTPNYPIMTARLMLCNAACSSPSSMEARR